MSYRMHTLIRFAGVGLANTVIDVLLFMRFHDQLGILLANAFSTSAGMLFSFVANGLFTFRARSLTVRQAVLFFLTTGTSMWLAQPLLIHLALELFGGTLLAKMLAIGCCFVANYTAYRFAVWPTLRSRHGVEPRHSGTVST